ncbi:Fanconi anemia core complex-associated protein 100 [Hyperolius riggenbachi]|uniref:Fanconi anemia core complex-associated protein 100 n=1 Tax=Hyperolius riggenbachi TaxID=752182 RepID=UPI0035A2D8A9
MTDLPVYVTMPVIEPLVNLQCAVGGLSSNKGRIILWDKDIYVSSGDRFLYVFSLEGRLVSNVYVFPGHIWHMELDRLGRQLYVLCTHYGICLLEWDEAGRLLQEADTPLQTGSPAVHHIGPGFVRLPDPSIRAFTLAGDVLVMATQQQQESHWLFRLCHRKSLLCEDPTTLQYRELNISPKMRTANTDWQPVLCCVSLLKDNKLNRVASGFTLEAPLFTRLFGVDPALLDSPIILCGFPDGQVMYFPVKNQGSSHGGHGSTQSSLKLLYHLEQPVVSIGATGSCDAGTEQPIRSSADVSCDCVLFVGERGSLVYVTSGEEEGAFCEYKDYRLQAPVCCAFFSLAGVYYSTPSDLFFITIPHSKDGASNPTASASVVCSVRHNVPMIAALAQFIHTSDELVLLSSRGRLMLCKLSQKGSVDQCRGLGSTHAGHRIKELLSGIGSVSDRVSRLKSAVNKKRQSLQRLNHVMSLSRQLLSNQQTCPVLCDVSVSWTRTFQTDRLTVACMLENRTSCMMERGWTLCVLVSSDASTSYTFPLIPLRPGERTAVTFPLSQGPYHCLDFPMRISSTLVYSLKGLFTDCGLAADASVCSASQQDICVPLQEHRVDLLQCLRCGPRTSPSSHPTCATAEDVVKAFVAGTSGLRKVADDGGAFSNEGINSAAPLRAQVRVSAAMLSQALQNEKSGRPLSSALLHWLLSAEVTKERNLVEVEGVAPDGTDFTLRVQEILVSDLMSAGSIPAVEIQMLSSHLHLVASLHLSVIQRLQGLLQQIRADGRPHAPDLDLGKIQQLCSTREPLLKELKTLRERQCADDEAVSRAATQRLLHIYRELRDPGLLFM